MWRKQEEPKTPSTTGEVKVPPKVEPAMPKAMPQREASAPGGHLTKALKIKGEITGSEDIFIDGEVHGQIRIAEGKVTVGPSGRLAANVEAREIVVRGKVKGDLNARERVQIDSGGSIIGDVVTRRIAIDDGGEVRGHVDTTRSEERRPARVALISSGVAEPRHVTLQAKEQAKESLPTA